MAKKTNEQKNQARKQAYNDLKSLGVTDLKILRKATPKLVEETKKLKESLGSTKVIEKVMREKRRNREQAVKSLDLQSFSKSEQNKLIKAMAEKRIKEYGKIGGQLTKTERDMVKKEIREKGVTVEDLEKKMLNDKNRSIDRKSRFEEHRRMVNGDMTKEEKKIMEKINKEKGLYKSHSYGFNVVSNMKVFGLTREQAEEKMLRGESKTTGKINTTIGSPK